MLLTIIACYYVYLQCFLYMSFAENLGAHMRRQVVMKILKIRMSVLDKLEYGNNELQKFIFGHIDDITKVRTLRKNVIFLSINCTNGL